MKVLVTIAVVTILIAIYVLSVRPRLRAKLWAKPFFDWIEPIEIFLWRKSETILWARLKMAVGVLLTILTQLGSIDLTPLMPFVPDAYEPLVRLVFNLLPLTITAVGWVDEKLRKDTTKPLEIVELPSDVPADVADALARADEAKVDAVAAAATVEKVA